MKIGKNQKHKGGINRQLLPPPSLFIEHEVDGSVIAQRPADGYINATAMCKKAGKLFAHYYSNQSTKSFLDALAADIGIPITALIQMITGGNNPKSQGTWVHPRVAIHLAQWLSPEFAVRVSQWVFDWMQGKASGYMPVHVKRYMANRAKIPPTHFSMLNEIYLNLIAPLEDAGFVLPDKMLPDASTGKMFSSFLRQRGINVDDFPDYEHEFLDNRRPVVMARLYPNKHLADFRAYFNDTWMPERAEGYFGERAPEAVPYLKEIILALPSPQERGGALPKIGTRIKKREKK